MIKETTQGQATAVITKSPDQTSITTAQLCKLPEAWLVSLRQAADETDPEAVDAIINKIRRQDESLAAELADIVKGFRFDVLQNIFWETEAYESDE